MVMDEGVGRPLSCSPATQVVIIAQLIFRGEGSRFFWGAFRAAPNGSTGGLFRKHPEPQLAPIQLGAVVIERIFKAQITITVGYFRVPQQQPHTRYEFFSMSPVCVPSRYDLSTS